MHDQADLTRASIRRGTFLGSGLRGRTLRAVVVLFLELGLPLLTGVTLLAATVPRPLTPEEYRPQVVEGNSGRVLVVNFWATWCEPCREEMPALAAVARKFPAEELSVVLVSTDSMRSSEQVSAFLESAKVTLPCRIVSSRDPANFIDAVDRAWDGSLPYTVVYGRDGKPTEGLSGRQTEASFTRAIRKALSGPSAR
jgi:thiol-disulfide isomerase/thioredoxin